MIETSRTIRFSFLDALRGYSAITVVLFHLYISIDPFLQIHLPPILDTILRFFKHNVMVFFVLSGFVIACSIKNAVVTGTFYLNFIVRRFVRLDPPYWCTIILTLGMAFLSQHYFSQTTNYTIPSTEVLAAQFFYLQEFLGYENFVLVSWTLCYEVQFYLYFVGVLWLHQSVIRRFCMTKLPSTILLIATLLLPSLLSIAQMYEFLPFIPGLFSNLWYSFLSGVFIFWEKEKKINRGFFWGYVLFTGLFFAVPLNAVGTYTFLILLLIYSVTKLNKLSWTGGFVLQYLGKISYSLYLIHFLVGCRAQALMIRLFGSELSPVAGLMVYFISVALSVIAAHYFYHFIEQPCLTWSQKFNQRIQTASYAS